MAHISGQDPRDPGTVQQYVAGEAYTGDYGFSSFELQPSVPPPSEVSHIREKRPVSAVEQIGVAEPSITEDHFEVEESEKGELEPAPTVEQRRYSVDWNPAQ